MNSSYIKVNPFSERLAKIIEKINLESKNEEVIQEEQDELKNEENENLRRKEEVDALEWPSLINFELTEGIIITLLSTTTANIIGIFILVVKFLFATRK